MTAIPRELARKRSADVKPARPAQPAPVVIEGKLAARRGSGWTVTGVFVLLLVGFLLAGFLLSMLQQHG